MVDLALIYGGGIVILFFFWIYGIVSFVLDVKNYLIPAYCQWRRDDEGKDDSATETGEHEPPDAL